MRKYLNFSIILKSVGFSLLVVGLMMLTSLFFAIYYNEDTISDFIFSSLITVVFAITMILFSKIKENNVFDQREAFLIVLISWILIGVFGSLPFILSGSIKSFIPAFFETVSGFTTTGASIMTDIEAHPKSVLYWRSLTHWLGGMGILVLVIAIMPTVGYGGVKLFVAEVSGPNSNKLHPKIKTTALYLWLIYLGLTLILLVLLLLGDMNFFESLTHAFGTVSTGGFSPKNTSIFNYSSYIQVVITIFMFLGAVNFSIYYLIVAGKLKKAFLNQEMLLFLGFVVLSSLIVVSILLSSNYPFTIKEAFVHSFFQVTSIVSTCGFGSADYMLWPQLSWFVLFLMFFTGGMIGSTSGGIKFTRYLVLIKNLRNEIKKTIHPNIISEIKLNNIIINEEAVRNFLVVFVAYIFCFGLGTLSLSVFLDEPMEAISISISCLSGIGPGFGQFGPAGNYSGLHDVGKLICCFLMIIGRLEVIAFFAIFNISFWKR